MTDSSDVGRPQFVAIRMPRCLATTSLKNCGLSQCLEIDFGGSGKQATSSLACFQVYKEVNINTRFIVKLATDKIS